MLVKRSRGWELPESVAASEETFRTRRALLKAAGAAVPLIGAGVWPGFVRAATNADDPTAHLYPVPRYERYKVERQITDEDVATTYNNFYEFGSHKKISKKAQELKIRPWDIVIDGLVEQPLTIGIDELLAKMPLEERVYRHRCVEAWSIVVPYSGFPMKALLDLARPLGSARYVVMQSFEDPENTPGQRQSWYPWPYVEGLTLAEASNELAFMATGYYGKPIPKQNGSPLRLAVPWKYGFKHIKSIVRFSFTEERPATFWNDIAPREYGFWANVNPAVRHPRWTQTIERDVETGREMDTVIYNGYGEFVADLYSGMEDEKLFM
jgi:sulfoxide reductase catalytic subunit YedY